MILNICKWISLYKDKVVSKMGEWVNIGNSEAYNWDLSWRKELFAWEEEQKMQLISLITVV